MYDRGWVLSGLALFVLLVTLPIWYNWGTRQRRGPALSEGAAHCVMPVEYMRTSHMKLLIRWRDEIVHEGLWQNFEVDGKSVEKGLENGCLGCHVSREKFCDACHRYASVDPRCWQCHD